MKLIRFKSLSFNQKDAIKYFDCNEGDIKSTSFPTGANLKQNHKFIINKVYLYNLTIFIVIVFIKIR